jgi:hypothetical protein
LIRRCQIVIADVTGAMNVRHLDGLRVGGERCWKRPGDDDVVPRRFEFLRLIQNDIDTRMNLLIILSTPR